MIYEIDHAYEFRLLPGTPFDENFLLSAKAPDGTDAVIKLAKLPFQKTEAYRRPPVLKCRVKGIDEQGLPIVSHITPPYVYELYRDTFSAGGTFECDVIFVPAKPAEEPYMIKDRYGIFYRLNEPEGLLTKNQRIRCKFTSLGPTGYSMTRVDEGAKLPYFSPDEIAEATGLRAFVAKYLLQLIKRAPELDNARSEIKAKNPLWLLNTGSAVLQHLPEWLCHPRIQRQHRACRAILASFRSTLLYLLEGSGFLNAVSAEHRMSLRQRLTDMVDSIDPYLDTLAVISRGEQDIFVESILDKLRRSGYLYHPAQQFGILMIIFRLYPHKVADYLSRIFESIFGRDLENWKREPFRSAFVEQFKIYVDQARTTIDAMPLAETRAQKAGLEAIITAIALQLILADGQDGDVNRSRTESLFYRYISLLRPLYSEALLSKSFLALMGASLNTRLKYSQLKEPMMMMTEAAVMPDGDFMTRLPATHRYSNGHVDFSISPDGLRIALTGRRDSDDRVIPEGLMPWLRPQIILNGIRGMAGKRLRQLSEHKQWWHDIEANLFIDSGAEAEQINEKAIRHQAEPGDVTEIVIEGVDDYFDNNPTFRCRIDSHEFEPGSGILKRDQIVGYNLKQPSERAWRRADGSPMRFLATVIDVASDGSYVFSMRDEIDDFIDSYFNFDDEYIVIVAGINEHDYSAISSAGIGMFLEKDPDQAYSVGDIVTCRMIQTSKQGQLRAYITGRTDNPADRFDKIQAFAKLLHSIDQYEPDGENDNVINNDIEEILSTGDIREIIGILRFKAIAETDLITAYDYLRYSRLLAMLIDDIELADRLATHAALLTMHQYYAVNSRIDANELETLAEASEADPLLHMIYHRLEMVSWLSRPDRNGDLFATANNPANELEGSLAKMVLSYNMLSDTVADGSGSIASDILQGIKKKLNVNNETRRGKYYGSESKYLEFKTSIVFPATAPGKGMREDPDVQQFHILSRIAGMLNAKGGRLYLGVNDNGYEVGMHDDFKYFERHTMQFRQISAKIKSVGSLVNYLDNLIDSVFGKAVAKKIEVCVDDEAEKEVVYFDIAESLEPVFLDGRLFVRQSGQATYEYHNSDIDNFLREREDERLQKQTIAAEKLSVAGLAKASTVPEPIRPADVAADALASTDAGTASDNPVLATSQWRPNVLHDYEAGYARPLGYIYFTGEKHIIYSSKDLYKDPGFDDCRQALVIPHDMADAYLVIGYENERALRIPLAEIYEKGENTEVEYNTEYKPLFAALACKDDGLVTVGADSKGNLWKRVNRISQMEQSHLMSIPRRVHDAPINHTVAYEVALGEALPRLADSLADKINSKSFGATMRVKESSPDCNYKIMQLVADCHTAS